ncbi:MAG: NUDIX hydrolase [Proteobacteria bacterium]|nr:NUDIX hydrolase [Pseudomonadota bacterium]
MPKSLKQFAALPVSVIDGRPYVLLITSRETRRWIIPKGHPDRRLGASALARLEAFEEAGVSGTIQPRSIGRYQSAKRLSSGKSRPCEVIVFRLDVDRHLDDWKEKGERERRWMPLEEAAELAADGGLGAFLAQLNLMPEALATDTNADDTLREPG